MKPSNSTNFKLEKLYLDCIDDFGNCFIIYWAKLEIYFIRVIYSGLIFSDSIGTTFEKSVVKKISGPQISGLLEFNNDLLQIRGSWKRADDALPLFSFKDTQNNELIWNCHHPKAFTEIAYNDSTYSGFGYAETLSLTIKPWDLPINELRWGRFLSDDHTVTWIHWTGIYPLNKIFCNGVECNDAIFEADRIVFGSGTYVLNFQEPSVIRIGKLSNVLLNLPWLKIIFNSRILNTLETKYKAKSILCQNSKIKANGWSLYEVVIWKK
jgi:hypothetical protein